MRTSLGWGRRRTPPDERPESITAEALRGAMNAGTLCLYYLPIVDMQREVAVEVEALLRWPYRDDLFIPPLDFLPMAESSGQMGSLTRWIFATAISQLGEWLQLGLDIGVSVNLSASDLEDTELPDYVGETLAAGAVTAAKLSVEIAERSLRRDPVVAARSAARFAEVGCRVVIDDFGKRLEDTSAIRALCPARLKVDRDYVMGMIRMPSDASRVKAAIRAAGRLGVKVVGEGTYSRQVWDHLRALGCDEAQGFYMSPPQGAEELTQWLCDSTWSPRDRDNGSLKETPILAD